MLVMTALYLLCGHVQRIGGSFSLHELGGLYRARPLLTAIVLVLFFAVPACRRLRLLAEGHAGQGGARAAAWWLAARSWSAAC